MDTFSFTVNPTIRAIVHVERETGKATIADDATNDELRDALKVAAVALAGRRLSLPASHLNAGTVFTYDQLPEAQEPLRAFPDPATTGEPCPFKDGQPPPIQIKHSDPRVESIISAQSSAHLRAIRKIISDAYAAGTIPDDGQVGEAEVMHQIDEYLEQHGV